MEFLWNTLQNTRRPIVMYGMGNGGDRLLDICQSKGLFAADIFASDGFVRGHSFRGYKVKSLTEIEAAYEEFIILLAFGTSRPDVMNMLKTLSQKHTLLAPHMPVFGNTLFDEAWFSEHRSAFDELCDLLADEQSKATLKNLIDYMITGEISPLFDCMTSEEEAVSLLQLTDAETYVDGGAYNGDTVASFVKTVSDKYSHIYAFEPDGKSCKKLVKRTEDTSVDRITLFNKGLWSGEDMLSFESKAARGSALSPNGGAVPVTSLDNALGNVPVSYLKLDVEGAEREALLGAENILKTHKPKLNIALYHRTEDIITLPFLIRKIRPDYRFYLRKHPSLPMWDVNLYGV